MYASSYQYTNIRAVDEHQAISDWVTLDGTMPDSSTAPIMHLWIGIRQRFLQAFLVPPQRLSGA